MELFEEKILQDDRKRLREQAFINDISRLKKRSNVYERKMKRMTYLVCVIVFLFLVQSFFLLKLSRNSHAAEPLQIHNDIVATQLVVEKPEKEIAAEAVLPAVIYRIQLGAFSKRVSSFETQILSFDTKWINEDGLTKYYVGNFDDYEYTKQQLKIFRNRGFPDAFIYKIEDGKKYYC